jgi:iron complex outermembrane receptor protein
MGRRAGLFGGAALAMTTAIASQAAAQAAPQAGSVLTEIVVTAQKRAQNLQNVPISITAVTKQALQSDRIVSVLDLSAVVPNLAVRQSVGGVGVPAFSMRGLTSYGVVPGSEKEVSIYIDGVYIGSQLGSAFELPDIDRIEVLRGPQGTLFGRNSTAGAINVITSDPSGRFGVHQELTVGNYDQFRNKTSVNFPTWGPISALVSFVHDEREGDIKNLGAGTAWYRNGVAHEGVLYSPKTLGAKDANTWFAAIKFRPNDRFSAIYKFDSSSNHFTPDGYAPVAVAPGNVSPTLTPILTTLLATQPTPIAFDTNALRPKVVNNWWSTPGYQQAQGHNLTINYRVNDSLSFKNVLAYRSSFIFANTDLDGLNGLVVTPQTLAVAKAVATSIATALHYPASFIPAIQASLGVPANALGAPYIFTANQTASAARQWSDEVQLNYESRYLTLTAGALYFHLKSNAGPTPGLGTLSFKAVPGGVIPAGLGTSYNGATSVAGYIQAEAHVTSQIDLIGGYRETQDYKNGTTLAAPVSLGFTYKNDQPAYTAGLNYKPTNNVLAYIKFSHSFVSGGEIGPVPWKPELVDSWEGGVKSDLFDRRVRANFAVFEAAYSDLQAPASGLSITPPQPSLGTLIVTLGGGKATGFEFEGAALPMRGLTLGLGVGYTDFHYTSVSHILQGASPIFEPTFTPKWTTNLSAQYETEPLFDEARVMVRMDANWRAKERTDSFLPPTPAFDPLIYSPATWIANGRLALEHIRLPHGDAQLAVWVKNLTDSRVASYPNTFGNPSFVGSTVFQAARTYGVDFIYDF